MPVVHILLPYPGAEYNTYFAYLRDYCEDQRGDLCDESALLSNMATFTWAVMMVMIINPGLSSDD